MQVTQPASELLQHAVASHQQGRLPDAERLYLQILASQPDHFDALHLLGIVKAQQGNNKEAEKRIKSALRKRPNSPEALSSLANVLSASQRFEDALVVFARSLQINPRDVGTLLNQGNTLAALRVSAKHLRTMIRPWRSRPRAPQRTTIVERFCAN